MGKSKSVTTPTTPDNDITKNLKEDTTPLNRQDHSSFRGIVGRLQWIKKDRADIAFGVKKSAHKLASPMITDMIAVKRTCRYLLGTQDTWTYLVVPDVPPENLPALLKDLVGFSDSDWAGDKETRKSTTCIAVFVGAFCLEFEVHSQASVALSSGESEFYALSSLATDLIFIRALLKEVGFDFEKVLARCDSSTARSLGNRQGASW